MALELVFHGGMCCGIKTIKGFAWPEHEEDVEPPRQATAQINNDSYGHHVRSSESFFTDSAPEESTEERFVRYVEFCKKRRPKGAIEVALARDPNDGDHSQVALWEPMLFEHGFKATVPEFLNSNSGNYITIYHLVYDAVVEKKAKKAAEAATPDPFNRRSE